MNWNFLKRNKEHLIYLSFLLIFPLIYFHTYLDLESLPPQDMLTSYVVRVQLLQQSVELYHDHLPLWNPYMMGGTPLFLKPDTIGFFDFAKIFNTIFSSPVAALKFTYVFSMIFAAFSMYYLVFYITKKPKAAFISALIYIFNAWIIFRLTAGNLTTIAAYGFAPLVILFTIKAFKEKKWVKNAVIVGVLFALHFYSGPDLKIILWLAPVFGIYILFYLIGGNFRRKFLKGLFVGLIVSFTFIGLISIKLLPEKEFIDMSSRAYQSWEQSTKRTVHWNELFTTLIEPGYEGMIKIHRQGAGYHIGIIAFLLMLYGIYKNRTSKITLFFTSVVIFSIFLVTGSFVFYFMWKYIPGYSGFRYLERTLVIFVFASSVLAGLGTIRLLGDLTNKFNLSFKKQNIFYFFIVILILLNLCVFAYSPDLNDQRNLEEVIQANKILEYISGQPGLFRMHVYETRGIDWGTEFNMVPLKLESLYGYEGAWLTEYMNVYLSVAFNDPAKFWGILNVKFLTSQSEINISGFEFVKKFPECEICYPEISTLQKMWGPYLYENKNVMPRAYFVKDALLIIGQKESAMQLMYGLMIDKNFDPRKTAIIKGKERVNDYGANELKRYKSVFLTAGSVDQNSYYTLKSYVDSGGILLPNIINNEDSITQQQINEMWDLLSIEYHEDNSIADSDVITINFDNKEVNLNKKYHNGFLVMSELYSMFPGWRAIADDEDIEILRANGVVSAVYLDTDYNNVLFKYLPKPFVKGFYITIITLILVIGYFVYRKFRK